MILRGDGMYRDPYENIRRDVPRPGKVLRHKKEYIKPLERRKEKELIKEGVDDYFNEE